jgi:HAD superfamily hydrolase (TIGR01459 family)
VVFLTNAPRPSSAIERQLAQLGVPREAFDAVVTSGDLTLDLIRRAQHRPMLHLGPERDRGLFAGLDISFAGFADAETIVCTGLYDDETEKAEDYRERLSACAARNAPMICANPDLRVARGNTVIECAGALAAVYEQLGGEVLYAGKPHAPVYDRVFELFAQIRGALPARHKVLAIGDGIHTDMLGAARAGLPAVFIASPVHMSQPLETENALAGLFDEHPAAPLAAMSALAW